MTLVDHTRHLVEKWYEKSIFLEEYTKEIKRSFAKNPLHRFIQGLRNYTLHYQLPLGEINFKGFSATDSDEFVTTWAFVLNKSSLLRYNDWNTEAKIYLETADENIIISDFTEKYFQLSLDFHTWIHKRLQEIHAEELAWLEMSIAKLKQLNNDHTFE